MNQEIKSLVTSASKIVFILLTISACIGFFFGKLGENNFMILSGSAFSFYFANKGNSDEKYLGK